MNGYEPYQLLFQFCLLSPTLLGILRVLVDSHLGDGRIVDFTCRRVVPLGGLCGGVGVEEALLAVAEDALLHECKSREKRYFQLIVDAKIRIGKKCCLCRR